MGRKNKGNHLAKARQESAASAAHTGRSNQRAVKKEFLKAKHINATVMILRGFLSGEEMTSLQLLGPRGRQVTARPVRACCASNHLGRTLFHAATLAYLGQHAAAHSMQHAAQLFDIAIRCTEPRCCAFYFNTQHDKSHTPTVVGAMAHGARSRKASEPRQIC